MRDKIEKWYRLGLWTRDMVASAADKGLICAEEYEEIVGESET